VWVAHKTDVSRSLSFVQLFFVIGFTTLTEKHVSEIDLCLNAEVWIESIGKFGDYGCDRQAKGTPFKLTAPRMSCEIELPQQERSLLRLCSRCDPRFDSADLVRSKHMTLQSVLRVRASLSLRDAQQLSRLLNARNW